MPYKLRKAPGKDLYWVVNKENGRKYSKSPLPLKRAEAQRRAIYASENGYVMRNKSHSMHGGHSFDVYGGDSFDDDIYNDDIHDDIHGGTTKPKRSLTSAYSIYLRNTRKPTTRGPKASSPRYPEKRLIHDTMRRYAETLTKKNTK
jgi:hypothetical protein